MLLDLFYLAFPTLKQQLDRIENQLQNLNLKVSRLTAAAPAAQNQHPDRYNRYNKTPHLR